MSRTDTESLQGRGFTVTEVLLVVAMLAILAAIGIPLLASSIRNSRVQKAIVEIKTIEHDIKGYVKRFQEYPLTLGEVGHGSRRDPWGNPYRYVYFAILPDKGKDQVRKDKNLHPLNTDYDLYSMGPDGESRLPLTAKTSHDDIIRANDGEFVGIAEEY